MRFRRCAPTRVAADAGRQVPARRRRWRWNAWRAGGGLGSCLLFLLCAHIVAPHAWQTTAARRITWSDLSPLHGQLRTAGLTAESFASYVQGVHDANEQRVTEGDLDHLIFYLLQSTTFTREAPIEPALSAKALVDSLSDKDRTAFLRDGQTASEHVAATVRARIAAFLSVVDAVTSDERLAFFRKLVQARFPDRRLREAALVREYLRAMRFVYQKEFVAQREGGAAAVAELYRTRGLSTDTAVEAGFLVHEGLGVVKALNPAQRIRRVLVVGPGLDLAPRTAFLDERPPESYQPWAVMDALLRLGLSQLDDLTVVAADINPRVVEHLRRAARAPPVLTLVSEIRETGSVSWSPEYRQYFRNLGSAAGEIVTRAGESAWNAHVAAKTVRILPGAARALHAESLDIVTERLTGPPFDVIVATNILPYFDERQVMLALSNVGAMLAPEGVFLHNEARASLDELTTALGFPFEQSRHVTIAAVRGAPAPLFDSVFVHRKK